MNWTLEPERPRLSTLATFLALSLLLHLAFLAWLQRARFSVAEPIERPIVVKLAPARMPPAVAPKPMPASPRQAPPAAEAKPETPPSAQKLQPVAPPEPKPVPARKQIVAPSDRENEQVPDKRAFLSDRNNRVEKESVKRGNPDAGEKATPPKPADRVASAPAPKPEAKALPKPVRVTPPPAPIAKPAPPRPPSRPKPLPRPEDSIAEPSDRFDAPPRIEPRPRAIPRERPIAPTRQSTARPRAERADRDDDSPRGNTRPARRRLPGLDDLLPPAAEVLAGADRAMAAAPEAAAARPTGRAADPRRDLVSAPPPKPGFFGGPRGTFDSLPDVGQGSMTMLNTKADRFAPFVRRVGTRVFQNLLIFQRQHLALNDIIAAHEAVTVRCLLDKEGRLKDVMVEDRSGSLAVDQTLLDALREAAFDANPPPSAANAKGEFEFLFESRLSASIGDGPSGPQVRMIESRLRVGLL